MKFGMLFALICGTCLAQEKPDPYHTMAFLNCKGWSEAMRDDRERAAYLMGFSEASTLNKHPLDNEVNEKGSFESARAITALCRDPENSVLMIPSVIQALTFAIKGETNKLNVMLMYLRSQTKQATNQ